MKRKWLLALPIAVALIGIVVGSILDFDIAQNIFSKDNAFGIAFAGFGEAPVYFFISAIGTLFIMLGIKHYKGWKECWWQKLIMFGLGVVAILVAVYTQMSHVVSVNALNQPDQKWTIGLPVSLVINGLGVLFGVWVYPKDNDSHLLRLLLTLVFIIGCAILCTEVIKHIMCRPRYRFLADCGAMTEDYYRNWWQSGKGLREDLIQTGLYENLDVLKENFKSFPSGHSTMTAFVIPALSYLPLLNKKIKANQEVLFSIGFVYTLIMMFSRMLVGAHFLSDVSFGLLFTSLSFIVFDFILSNYNKKHPIQNEEIIEY